MARIFNESFEAGHLLRFTGTTGAGASIVTSPVLDGLRCLQLSAGTAYVDISALSEFYVGFYFETNALTQGNVYSWETTGGALIGFLYLNPASQKLQVYDGNSVLLAGGSRVLTINTKYHIQIHVKIANAAGVADVKLDDVQEITFSGDTQPSTDTVATRLKLLTSAGAAWFDSYVINDTTGASDNTWPGVLKFYALVPSGPGFYVNNWSRSTGANNWQCVDEVPLDTSDYVYTTTPNIYESFSMSDQNLASVNYKALITSAVANKDSGTVQLALGIRDDDNNTNYWGINSGLGVSFGVVSERRTVDPSTGVTWTSSGINSTQSLIGSTTG